MKKLLLIIPGHLGKDTGATATLASDGVGSLSSFVVQMQEERWINLQQAISFCIAHATSDLKNEVEVRLVVPSNAQLGIYGGLIKIHDMNKEYFGLEDRVKLANDLDADVIEFHNNAAPFAASGFESLCFTKENSKGIISEGYLLCQEITNSMKNNMKMKVRDIKPIFDSQKNSYIDREIYIIKNCKNMCIITESGFMTDKKELSLLDVDLDGYNEQIGASIWLGYKEFYNKNKQRIS